MYLDRFMTGAYLVTQKSHEIINLAEPKSGFKLGLLLHCNFDYFCQKTYPLFHDIILVCNHDIQYSVLYNA